MVELGNFKTKKITSLTEMATWQVFKARSRQRWGIHRHTMIFTRKCTLQFQTELERVSRQVLKIGICLLNEQDIKLNSMGFDKIEIFNSFNAVFRRFTNVLHDLCLTCLMIHKRPYTQQIRYVCTSVKLVMFT